MAIKYCWATNSGCFVADRRRVCCRTRTPPSGTRLIRSWQGLGSLPGVHTSIRTVAGGMWVLAGYF